MTISLAPSVVGAIVAGVVTIVLAALAFKAGYEKASPKAREVINSDIEHYIACSQTHVIEWLEKLENAFEKDFHAFCLTYGFALDGETI